MTRQIQKFSHYSEIPAGVWRWHNFSPARIACRHCGEIILDFDFMDRLQRLRSYLGVPLTINCCYRCAVHNAFVGGVALSCHKLGRAADIRLTLNKNDLIIVAELIGFTGFGVNYNSFLHVDTGRKRRW